MIFARGGHLEGNWVVHKASIYTNALSAEIVTEHLQQFEMDFPPKSLLFSYRQPSYKSNRFIVQKT